MTKLQSKSILITLILVTGLAGCNPTAPEEPTTSPSGVMGQATVTVPPPTTTPSPEPRDTVTPEPASSTTPVPRIRVSENSNCREGPAANYLYQGVLLPGAEAHVLGMNAEGDYWLISGEQFPEEGCWLWGEYAEVEGDLEGLPVLTPPPSPTPLAGFDLYLKDFASCGSTQYAIFAVKNIGGVRLWSGYIKIEDWESKKVLHQRRERHPFAESPLPVCPPGHGNKLWPGETRYVHAPISPIVSGHTGIGVITLCPADHQGGNCVTEYSYFTLP